VLYHRLLLTSEEYAASVFRVEKPTSHYKVSITQKSQIAGFGILFRPTPRSLDKSIAAN
jgi:hypothetical protein